MSCMLHKQVLQGLLVTLSFIHTHTHTHTRAHARTLAALRQWPKHPSSSAMQAAAVR